MDPCIRYVLLVLIHCKDKPYKHEHSFKMAVRQHFCPAVGLFLYAFKLLRILVSDSSRFLLPSDIREPYSSQPLPGQKNK